MGMRIANKPAARGNNGLPPGAARLPGWNPLAGRSEFAATESGPIIVIPSWQKVAGAAAD